MFVCASCPASTLPSVFHPATASISRLLVFDSQYSALLPQRLSGLFSVSLFVVVVASVVFWRQSLTL